MATVNRKKTKIVATLGPATNKKETLLAMMDEGVNVFRINFSHADYEDVEKKIKLIRELNIKHEHNTAILADLQGPKLRVGVMKDEVIVNDGDEIVFATGETFEGTKERVYMTYDRFPHDAKPGEKILLDDGKLIFEVVST
ncbi:MAG: pyruvate kinase, partial [Bacteroidia bacterium]|nr:pyruvate kinase [Bacteroidia bacterium]